MKNIILNLAINELMKKHDKPGRPKKETKQFSIRCYPEDLPAIRAFCKALINKRESTNNN